MSTLRTTAFGQKVSPNNSSANGPASPSTSGRSIRSPGGRARAETFAAGATLNLFQKDPFTLKFVDPEKESAYSAFHGKRMKKGFISSCLCRAALLAALGIYSYASFDSTPALLINLAGSVVDICLVGLLIVAPGLFAGDLIQFILLFEVVVESCATVTAHAQIDTKGKVELLCSQYFILGVLTIGWVFAESNQKICLLRFPFALAGLIIFASCNVLQATLAKEEGVQNLFWLLTTLLVVMVGIGNGRVSDSNDRTLYVNLQRIKEQKESLAKQIKTANKLTSTVFSLTNDDGEEGESTEHDSGNETTEGDKSSNIVGEFDFLATFEKRVAGMVKKNEIDPDITKKSDAFSTLKDVMDDNFGLRFFRYFCHVQINIENLIFYEQVKLFKRRAEQHKKRIIRTFIREGSPSEVNIDSNQRKRCMANDIDISMFDESEVEIYKIMDRDIFPRFRVSNLGMGLLHCAQDENFRDDVVDKLDARMRQLDQDQAPKQENK